MIFASASWVWAEFVDQPLIARRLLDRVEVGALHVLDQRELQRLGLAAGPHDNRHLVQPGLLRRPPAPFAGDDLEPVTDRAHQQRRHDSMPLYRCRQLVEGLVVEGPPRVLRVRREMLDRHRARLVADGGGWRPLRCAVRPEARRGRGRAACSVRSRHPHPLLTIHHLVDEAQIRLARPAHLMSYSSAGLP